MVYTQPIKVGDIIIGEIISIGDKGDGIMRKDDFVIIVPQGQINQTYKVKITKVFPKYAFCEIIKEVN